MRLPGLPAALGLGGQPPAIHRVDPAAAASCSLGSYCSGQAPAPMLASYLVPPPARVASSCSAGVAEQAPCHTPPTAPALTGPPDWLLPAATMRPAACGQSPHWGSAVSPQAASRQVEEAAVAAAASPIPDPSAAASGAAAAASEAGAAAADVGGAVAASPAALAHAAPAEADAAPALSSSYAGGAPVDPVPVPDDAAAHAQEQACTKPEDAGSLPSLAAWQSTSQPELPVLPAADGPLPVAVPPAAPLPLLQPSLPAMPSLHPAAPTPLHLLSLQPGLGLLAGLAGGQLQLGAGTDVAVLQLEVLQLRQEVRGRGNAIEDEPAAAVGRRLACALDRGLCR